jgi:hypothetical protein
MGGPNDAGIPASTPHNVMLSQNRANSVKAYLANAGVNASRSATPGIRVEPSSGQQRHSAVPLAEPASGGRKEISQRLRRP